MLNLMEHILVKQVILLSILSEIMKTVWFLYMFFAFLMVDIKAAAIFFIGATNGSIDNSVSEAIKK